MASPPRWTGNDSLRPPEDIRMQRRPSATSRLSISASASERNVPPATPLLERADPLSSMDMSPRSSQPKGSQGSRIRGEASGSQEKPSQPDTTGSRNAPPGGDPERDAPSDPRAYCLLEIVSQPALSHHERPLIDIIAIQDQDESREEAWIYDFDRVASRNAKPVGAPRSTGQGSIRSGSDGGSKLKDNGKTIQGLAAAVDPETRVGPWVEGVAMVPLGDLIEAAATPAAREPTEAQLVPERAWADNISIRPPSIAPRRGSILPPAENSRPTTANAGGLSSAPPTADNGATKQAVNWLHHPRMLPAAIPSARVMAFSYPSYQTFSNSTLTLSDFLTSVSLELFAQIRRVRTDDDVEQVPLVFVACGFGGLVLQAAVTQPDTKLAALGIPAGVVLIDAPYPSLAGAVSGPSGAKKKPPPAIYGSVRMRRISEFVFDGQEGPIDCAMLWNNFEVERVKSGHEMPVVWMYNRSKTKQKPPDNELRGVIFKGLPTDRYQETDRYRDPEDPNYREVLSYLQRFLLFEAARSERLDALLEHLIEAQFPVDIVDQEGQSALHLAASVPNPTAVAILANQAGAGVLGRDTKGQTPLHKVIIRATELRPSDEVARGPFRDVIQRILRLTLKVDELDDSKRSAWEYATVPEFAWIRELRAHREMIQGPSVTAITAGLEVLKPPTDGPQHEAAVGFEAIVAEFFLEKRESERHEFINYETPTVFDLIYVPNKGPERILGLSRPRGFKGRSRCQWIHLPANNEQWIHDLFIKLKIKDNSMVSERHEGSRPFSRWMFPQAKRYKHSHEKRSSRFKKPLLKKIVSSALSPTSGDDSETSYRTRHAAFSTGEIPLGLPATALSDTDLTPEGTPTGTGGTWSPATPRAGNIVSDMDAVVIFMPVLGFETDVQRRAMTSVIQYVDKGYTPQHFSKRKALPQVSDTELLAGYLKHDRPVHCRRTLDQFSYYMLESTERRDRDQVSYKWGRKNPRLPKGERPVLMVDQLWLWALHNGTVISAFPNTWDPKRNKEFDLKTAVEVELAQNKTRRPIRSAEELVHLIIKMSVDFFHRTGPGGFQFQECFQSSINDIIEEQAKLLKAFRRLTRVLNNKVDAGVRSKMVEELFQLTNETRLLTEIMDIQDELNIVRSVLIQQRETLDKLLKILLRPEEERERSDLSERSDRARKAGKAPEGAGDGRGVRFAGGRDHSDHDSDGGHRGAGRDKRGAHDHATVSSLSQNVTVLKSKALVNANISIVDDNIKVVAEMKTYARNVQLELNTLLDLKQKQANAWEARFSREETEQTRRQGNIMFVFTIVTIVFLPLDFIASLMSMPVADYPRYVDGDSEPGWPLRTAYTWVFGVGTAILVPLMLLAIGVNRIAKFTEDRIRPSLRRRRQSASANNGDASSGSSSGEDDDDVDMDDAVSVGGRSKASTRTIHSNDGIHNDTNSDRSARGEIDPDYALLLGRWKFHARIPVLRRLWRYTASVTLSDDFSMESFRVWDYPFHRWVEQPLGRVAIRLGCEKAWIWVVGAEEGGYLSELPPRMWGEWFRGLFSGRRVREGMKKSSQGEEDDEKSHHNSLRSKMIPVSMDEGGLPPPIPTMRRARYTDDDGLGDESDEVTTSDMASPTSPTMPGPLIGASQPLPSPRSLPDLHLATASSPSVPSEAPSYAAGTRAPRRRYIDVMTTDEVGNREFSMRLRVGTWGRGRADGGGGGGAGGNREGG